MSWCGSDSGSRKSASCTSTAPWESRSLSFWGKNEIMRLLIIFGAERAVSAKSFWECRLQSKDFNNLFWLIRLVVSRTAAGERWENGRRNTSESKRIQKGFSYQ